MSQKLVVTFLGLAILFMVSCSPCVLMAQTKSKEWYNEKHRPQFHFSPEKNWMNDPNGLLYFDGEYHLFFQHDSYEKVFTNMSWGHAISNDLIHWKEYPKAIIPDGDGFGLIFSGSAVVDKNNTAGFGNNAFVAFYTGTELQQQQCIAYSTDKGRNWIKYKNNPVIRNEKDDSTPADFRDPKVMWHEETKKWIMSLAVKDHVEFWSSHNLLEWKKESEFGQAVGGHSGVWECPDLFELPVEGEGNGKSKRWVLLVNINPGGPNGGSATQYFVGDFDGKHFVMDEKFEHHLSAEGQWVDYGTDNYAGVTWFNVPDRKITIGWMNNWNYGMKAQTYPWRGAMTIPRTLKLVQTDKGHRIVSWPVAELESIYTTQQKVFNNKKVSSSFELTNAATKTSTYEVTLELEGADQNGFILEISNDLDQKVLIGFSPEEKRFFIDRTQSGRSDFSSDFPGKHYAPRLSNSAVIQLRMLVDHSSVEVFADGGLTVMTDLFYPDKVFSKLSLKSWKGETVIKKATLKGIKKIW
ncbi:MAG TPA: glycoside hydrolase family 32 protein [Cyclobacteriaceae bacterium]